MAIATKNSRLNKISTEYESLAKTWASLASQLNTNTELLKKFAAWRNEMFLTDSGDVDVEDMVVYRTTFNELFSSLAANFMVLQELNDMPASTPEEFKASNDAFIAKYGIDIAEFDKRFS